MINKPIANAIEVVAIGAPRVPIAATSPARPKLTPAPMKRPTDVQKPYENNYIFQTAKPG